MLFLSTAGMAQSVRVEVGTSSSTADKAPFYNSGKAGTVQMLYMADQIGMEGTIDTIWFYCSAPGTLTDTMLQIYMGHTALTANIGGMPSANTFLPAEDLDLVYSSGSFTHPTVAGWVPIVLQNPFEYNGVDNLAIVVASKRAAAVSAIKYATFNKTDAVLTRSVAGTYPPGGSASKLSTLPVLRLSISATSCARPKNLAVSSITPTDALLSWEQSGHFVVKVDDQQIDIAEGNSCQLTGLDNNRDYVAEVCHVCGEDSSSWAHVAFRTAVDPAGVPYEWGFDEEDVNWMMFSSTSNEWTVGSAVRVGDEGGSLYISNDGGATNTATTSRANVVLASRLVALDDAGDYEIGFDWNFGGSSSNYLRVALVPADVELAPSTSGVWVLPAGSVVLDNGRHLYNSDGWSHYEGYTLSAVESGEWNLVFAWCTGGSDNPPAPAIDNISLNRVECGGPSSVSVINTSATSAEIEMMSEYSEDFMIVYKKTGTSRYDTVFAASPYVFENLEERTSYEGIVYSDCGDDNFSIRGIGFQFSTTAVCPDITGVIVSNITVDGATINWTVESGAGVDPDEYTVTISRGTSFRQDYTTQETTLDVEDLREFTDYEVTVTANCEEGDSQIEGHATFMTLCASGGLPVLIDGTSTSTSVPTSDWHKYSYAQTLYLASELEGPTSIDTLGLKSTRSVAFTRNLTIYMAHTSASSISSYQNLDFQQVYSGDVTFYSGWNMIPMQTSFEYNGTDNLVIAYDDNTGACHSSGDVFYGVSRTGRSVYYQNDNTNPTPHTPSGGNTTSFLPAIKIPGGCDVSYSCTAPTVSVDDVAETSASLSWTPGGEETMWSVFYRAQGEQEWNLVTEEDEGSSVQIDDLEPGTTYQVKVISLCGYGDESETIVSLTTYSYCPELTGLAASYIGSDTVIVSWSYDRSTSLNEPDSYYAAIFSMDGEEISTQTVDDTVAVFENLEPETRYVVRVSSLCSAGESDTADLRVTTTEYVDPETVVFRETFEDMSTYADWTFENGSYQNNWVIGSAVSYGGSHSIYISNDNGSHNDYNTGVNTMVYAYIPVAFYNTGIYRTYFDWKSVGESGYDYLNVGIVPSNYSLTGLTIIPGDITKMHQSNYLNMHSEWTREVCDVEINEPGTYNVVLFWKNDNSGGTTPPAAVDNIMIRALRLDLCNRPDSVSVEVVDPYTATLTIHGEQADGYTVKYRATRDSEYQTVTTEGNSITLSDLVTNTTYVGEVFTNCSEGGMSRYSTPFTFSLEDPETVILHATFEEPDHGWVLSTGTTNYFTVGAETASEGTHSLYITNGSGCSYNTSSSSFATAYHSLNIEADGVYQFEYDWKCYGESTYDYMKVFIVPDGVTVSSSNNPPADAIMLHEGSYLNQQSGWQHQGMDDIFLASGQYRLYVTWYNDGSQGSNPPAVIDNIYVRVVTAYTCHTPSSVSVNDATLTSATLTITGDTPGYMVLLKNVNDPVYDTILINGENSYAFSNLTPNSTYSGMVYGLCEDGGTSYSGVPFSIRTVIAPRAPWSEDFEGSVAGWDFTTTQTNHWMVGTATHNGDGTHSLYITNDGSSNAYTNGSEVTVFASFEVDFPAGEYEMSFDWKATGESTWDYMRAALVPVTMAGQILSTSSHTHNSINPWPEGSIELSASYLNQHSTWTTQSGTITVPSAAHYLVTFMWTNDGSSGTLPAAVDNISFTRDLCPAPTGIHAYDVTAESFSVSVDSESDSVMLLFRAGSQPYDTLITGLTHTFEGLTTNTSYQVKAYAYCGADGLSRSAVETNVHTLCGIVDELPWSEDFEDQNWNAGEGANVMAPNCWSATNTTYSSSYWSYSASDFAYAGSRAAMFKSGTSTTDTSNTSYDMLVTPTLALSGSNEMIFYARGVSSRIRSRLQVRAIAESGGGFQPLSILTPDGDTVSIIEMNSDQYGSYTVDLSSLSGNTRIAFVVDGRSGNIYLDDVLVRQKAACPAPENLAFVEATSTTATLTWDDTSNEGWTLFYKRQGDSLLSQEVETIPGVLTDLEPNTQYTCYVVGNCPDGTYSYQSASITFRTTCSEISAPYVENFEEWNGTCWTRNVNSRFMLTSNVSYSGSHSLMIGASSTTNKAVLATPPVLDDLSTLSVSVALRSDAETTIKIGAMTDPTVANTFSTLANVRVGTDWQMVEIPLSAYTGTGRYIAFQSESESPIYMDSLLIDNEARCFRPFNVQSNATDETATISWNANGATQFNIQYGLSPYTVGSTESVLVENASNYTLDNLQPLTIYDVYIQAVCGEGSVSDWTKYSFSTACGVIHEYPFSENFESVSGATTYNEAGPLPECWGAYSNGDNEAYIPHVTSSGSYHYGFGKSLTMTSGGSDYGSISLVYMPKFDTAISNLQVNFWTCMENASNGVLSVGYLTSDNPASFVQVQSVTSSTSGRNDSVQFSGVPSSAQYIAFKWEYSSSYFTCALDNIVVKVINNQSSDPTECPIPFSVEAVASADEATLEWEGTGISYEVGVRLNEAGASWHYFNTLDNIYTVSGLLMNTQYVYSLRQICGLGDTSEYVYGNFTTTEVTCPMASGLHLVSTGDDYAIVGWDPNPEVNTWIVHFYGGDEDYYDTTSQNTATFYELSPEVAYSVSVRSMCSATLTSDWCEPLGIYIGGGCPPVSGVTVSDITSNTATINWSCASSVSQWEIQYGNHGFSAGSGARIIVGSHPQTIHGLQPSTAYDVYVRSICDGSTYGEWSDVATFTTTAEQGIEDVDIAASVAIMPNPATTSATIHVNGVQGDLTIVIFDMGGRELMRQDIACDADCESLLNVTDIAKGSYFVRIIGQNVNLVKKLIIY